MGNTSGISGPSSSGEPSDIKDLGKSPEGENVLHAQVKTLGQLKQVLVQNLGEKNGTKVYNEFIQNFAMMMLEQVQQSAQRAQQAAQQMRMSGGLTT